MSQIEKRRERVNARKHKNRLDQIQKRSSYQPVKRIKFRCSDCHEILVRKVTETVPKRCPFCQSTKMIFRKV